MKSRSRSECANPPSIWRRYQEFVRTNAVYHDIVEEICHQTLFWIPQSAKERGDRRWREVLHGLLSLQRMINNLALQDQLPELYGTTVEIMPPEHFSPTQLRHVVLAIHNLMPVILEISPFPLRSRVRLWLEWCKFCLRLARMGSYWYQLYQHKSLNYCGLEISGGRADFSAKFLSSFQRGITVEQEISLQRRENYIGKRTGRRVISSSISMTSRKNSLPWPFLLGELWHLYRPLHWASIEYQRSPNKIDLFASFAIDICSIFILEKFNQSDRNLEELKRRKLKLLLYMLRSPIYDGCTAPFASYISKLVRKMPMLGSLLESYFLDWLSYWKHPLVSELD